MPTEREPATVDYETALSIFDHYAEQADLTGEHWSEEDGSNPFALADCVAAVRDKLAEAEADRRRLTERISAAADDLAGANGLTPGDALKIQSAAEHLDAAMREGEGE